MNKKLRKTLAVTLAVMTLTVPFAGAMNEAEAAPHGGSSHHRIVQGHGFHKPAPHQGHKFRPMPRPPRPFPPRPIPRPRPPKPHRDLIGSIIGGIIGAAITR